MTEYEDDPFAGEPPRSAGIQEGAAPAARSRRSRNQNQNKISPPSSSTR